MSYCLLIIAGFQRSSSLKPPRKEEGRCPEAQYSCPDCRRHLVQHFRKDRTSCRSSESDSQVSKRLCIEQQRHVELLEVKKIILCALNTIAKLFKKLPSIQTPPWFLHHSLRGHPSPIEKETFYILVTMLALGIQRTRHH